MAPRVLEQVAEQVTQAARVADQLDGPPLDFDAQARAFLGGEREQVHRLMLRRAELEPAHREQLLHRRVERRHLLRELLPQRVRALRRRRPLAGEQLGRNAQPRERGAQRVRRAREQRALRPDQRLDARRGLVEARGELRHLVAATHLGARREVAAAEGVHMRRERLDAAREPTRERIGDEAEQDGQQAEAQEEPAVLVRRRREPQREPAPVGELQREAVVAGAARQVALATFELGQRGEAARFGEAAAVGVEQRGSHAERGGDLADAARLLLGGRVGRGQHERRNLRGGAEQLVLARALAVPEEQQRRAGEERDHHSDQREIDAQIEPAHASASCRLANT